MSIPLSLYIHIPWCLQKCPYCDFNSHNIKGELKDLPEKEYIRALLSDLDADILRFKEKRSLSSIFIGGGTPSLFSGDAIFHLLDGIFKKLEVDENIEITLEANPGTVDERHFLEYYRAGVNRISIGIQSFNSEQLKKLGRIHTPEDAIRAVSTAQNVGFDNINIDLMFGLPGQTETQALSDIRRAVSLEIEHISYYQLTLEPNTAFAYKPPKLPTNDLIDRRFNYASEILNLGGYRRYEVSAWSRGKESKHNRNYWEYGDYLGIGAGAHGKITIDNSNSNVEAGNKSIIRTVKSRSPSRYLSINDNNFSVIKKNKIPQSGLEFCSERKVKDSEKAFEFMLNAMRLVSGFPLSFIEGRGLISVDNIIPNINKLVDKELIIVDSNMIIPTPLGQRFVNDMIESFL